MPLNVKNYYYNYAVQWFHHSMVCQEGSVHKQKVKSHSKEWDYESLLR